MGKPDKTELISRPGKRIIPFIFPVMRFLGLVWFDAANVVGCAEHELVHQDVGLSLHKQNAHVYNMQENENRY